MKKNHQNYIVIIAGGTGTRLWPLSRKSMPKQFHRIFQGESLFEQMMKRSADHVGWDNVFVVCPSHLSCHVQEQAPDLPVERIIQEPCQKDNFPAIVLGVDAVLSHDRGAHVAVLWSDHHIVSEEIFSDMLESAFDISRKNPEAFLLIGTPPKYPETGFGYIRKGKEVERDVFKVRAFVEKPNKRKATKMGRSESYLWNTGYKVFNAETFMSEVCALYSVKNLSRDILFQTLPKGSIEDMYTHQKDELIVTVSDMLWSDVGNWRSLADMQLSTFSNAGACITVSSDNTSSVSRKPVVVVGVSDIIVVDTQDAILVVHRDHVQKVKEAHVHISSHYPELL